MSVWLGVDPGAVSTGLALRNGRECLAWHTVKRADDETEIGPGPIYWAEILRHIATFTGASVRIAIEGVRPPSPFARERGKKTFASPIHPMALAATFGAIYVTYPDAVVVPPGGNGSGYLASYPEQLVTDAERRHGLNREAGKGSKVSHARSAWDVSVLAERNARGAA